jgi:hypothetical protein
LERLGAGGTHDVRYAVLLAWSGLVTPVVHYFGAFMLWFVVMFTIGKVAEQASYKAPRWLEILAALLVFHVPLRFLCSNFIPAFAQIPFTSMLLCSCWSLGSRWLPFCAGDESPNEKAHE